MHEPLKLALSDVDQNTVGLLDCTCEEVLEAIGEMVLDTDGVPLWNVVSDADVVSDVVGEVVVLLVALTVADAVEEAVTDTGDVEEIVMLCELLVIWDNDTLLESNAELVPVTVELASHVNDVLAVSVELSSKLLLLVVEAEEVDLPDDEWLVVGVLLQLGVDDDESEVEILAVTEKAVVAVVGCVVDLDKLDNSVKETLILLEVVVEAVSD